MNQWLAQVYGTGGSPEDLEKIAQAEMAQQLAQGEGLDLSHLSEEQLSALHNEVLGGQGEEQPQQGQPQQPQMPQQGQIDPSQITPEVMQQVEQVLTQPDLFRPEVVQEAQAIQQVMAQMQGQPQPQMAKTAQERLKEAQEKFEEADFLGRVMAHSFNQEVEKIAMAKQAASIGGAARAVDRGAQGLGKKMVGMIGRTGGAEAAMNPNTARAIGYGTGALGLGATGAAAHGIAGMSKEASSINAAAEKLAAEILTANGIDPATLKPVQPQAAPAPTPAPAPAVAAPVVDPAQELVEKRAYQILNQLGFTVQ